MNKLLVRVRTVLINEYFILSIILVLGFILRLYKIDNPIADWHSWRQADTSSVSRNFVKNGINMFFPEFDDISSIQTGIDNPTGIRMVEFPVYNAIHAIIYKNFSIFNLEKWGRILTTIISLLTTVFLFLLAKKHYSSKVGLLTAFFFTFIPFNIYFSRVILPDPLGVLFAVAGLYFFGINIVVSGLLFALALLQKPFFGVYLFPLIPELIKKENLKKSLAFLSITMAPFMVWRYWESLHPEGISFYKWAFNGDRIRFHPAWFRWLFGERIGILILGGWGLIPFVMGLIKKQKNKFNLLLNLGMLTYLIAVATANVRHDYYQILIIPAISISLALGSVWLWKRNMVSKLVLILSILVMFLVGWDRIKPFYQVNHPELMEVGNVVDETLPKDAKVIAPYNGDTAFLYQMNRKGWPAVDDSIDGLIERGATHYVSLDLGSPDTVNFSKRFVTLQKTDKFIILDLQKEITKYD